jgi:hypothetical protein
VTEALLLMIRKSLITTPEFISGKSLSGLSKADAQKEGAVRCKRAREACTQFTYLLFDIEYQLQAVGVIAVQCHADFTVKKDALRFLSNKSCSPNPLPVQ